MIIDLSIPVNEQTPVYPGDAVPKIEPAGVIDKDGWTDHTFMMNNHLGTHIDAPMHMVAGGESLDAFPVETFVGPGKLVKGLELDDIKEADIKEGDIVLFHTGTSARLHEPDYYTDYPAMSKEVAQYLVDQKVKMVGVDTGSVDNQHDNPIHKLLLKNGVLVIENLINLEAVAGKKFTVYALPIALQLDAAPARVIAELA